jgi:hypothetical protein
MLTGLIIGSLIGGLAGYATAMFMVGKARRRLGELTEAERQLIELIQYRDAQNLTVTIAVDNNRRGATLNDHDSGIFGSGAGEDFDSAWHIVAHRLRNAELPRRAS